MVPMMGTLVESVSQSLPVLPSSKIDHEGHPAVVLADSVQHRSGPKGATAIPANSETALDAHERETQAEVSAEAAESFIEDKRIGERIKYLRQKKHMGLVELGKYTGLSASFLSQLETGRVVPTLRNLARIAMVFSKDMSYFFEPERFELFRILRAEERQKLPQTGAEEPGYYFESLGQVPSDQPIAPYVAEFLPGSGKRVAKAHQHTGNEFLYVLDGCLKLEHDGKMEALEGGDAVFFNAEAVHSYESEGDKSCTALILTMPEPLRGTHSGAKVPLAVATTTKPAKAPVAGKK
jgi:transcriptional regulator with XRE-family HTH domain